MSKLQLTRTDVQSLARRETALKVRPSFVPGKTWNEVFVKRGIDDHSNERKYGHAWRCRFSGTPFCVGGFEQPKQEKYGRTHPKTSRDSSGEEVSEYKTFKHRDQEEHAHSSPCVGTLFKKTTRNT